MQAKPTYGIAVACLRPLGHAYGHHALNPPTFGQQVAIINLFPTVVFTHLEIIALLLRPVWPIGLSTGLQGLMATMCLLFDEKQLVFAIALAIGVAHHC